MGTKPVGSGRYRSASQMWDDWEIYKDYCDNKTKVMTVFSQKESRFVTDEIPAPVSYSIKGFCSYIGMSSQNFFATYEKNKKFDRIIARMLEECEIDTKEKLETNQIEARLGGLLLSKYGYSTSVKQETDLSNIDKLIEGIDKMVGD